jgi:glutaredoxin
MKKVVVASASWCPQCGPFKKRLDAAGVAYIECDVDDPANLSFVHRMNVRGLPTTFVFDEWEELIGVVVGVDVKKVEELLSE